MSDLKPCPFCSGIAIYSGWSTGKPSKAIGWVQCAVCSAKGPSFQDDDDAEPAAAGAWNLRQAPAPAPREDPRLAGLRYALEMLESEGFWPRGTMITKVKAEIARLGT